MTAQRSRWWPLLALAACNTPNQVDLSLSYSGGVLSPTDGAEAAFPGLVGVINGDDDLLDGVRDWDARALDELDNELMPLQLQLSDRPVRLSLEGDPMTVRIWRADGLLLGEDGAEGIYETQLNAGLRTLDLWVELGDYNSRHALVLEELPGAADEAGEKDRRPLATLRLPLTGSPLILNHHLQPAERLWAMRIPDSWGETWSNAGMVATLTELLGDRFIPIPAQTYNGDVWVQDEMEFATLTRPDGQMDFVIDSIRNGQGAAGHGLDDVPEDLIVVEPDWAQGTWGSTRATSYDSFGNLEVTPPITVDGVYYPFGRIYYGSVGKKAPTQDLRDFLDSQEVQAPFALDTTWLIVGHVDEFSSFVPDPSSERGFKLVIADTDAAWAIIDQLDPELPLVRWDGTERSYQGHDIETIGELQEMAGLRELNEDLQRDFIDPNLETLLAQTGLTEDDVIRMPSLFYEPWGHAYGAVAMLPGMANLTVWNPEGETPTLFLPDPFLRGDLEDQSQDPMIAAVREAMPPDVNLVFLDDWFTYHMALGEVHCGTNVERQPLEQWWTAALHLVEE